MPSLLFLSFLTPLAASLKHYNLSIIIESHYNMEGLHTLKSSMNICRCYVTFHTLTEAKLMGPDYLTLSEML